VVLKKKISKTLKITSAGKDMENRDPAHCWECDCYPLWKTAQGFLKKVHPSEMKPVCQRDICSPLLTAALLTTVKEWKQPQCPSTEEWIKTVWSIHCGIPLSHKKPENSVICSITGGSGITVLHEIGLTRMGSYK
jgi:hypothetical protein